MYKYRFHLLLGLLSLLHFHQDTTTKELQKKLGVSRATCRRMIKCLRDQCYVQIEWKLIPGSRTQGIYLIRNWGVFSKKAVVKWAKKNGYN